MQSENRIFDDLSRLINGAAGTLAGVGREFEANAREKAKQWMSGMDFVSREEFEAVKAMAAAAREETEALKARLEALEKNAGTPPQPATKTRGGARGRKTPPVA
ncbi:MAG: accessory factor UbiK family protein [Sphingobium sp.]|jgi:BMFP domain-containing protein YqiC|nr:accessory factor UbiK family protein [Sphingobium sp.]MCI1272245.1 accessory factor UbiK family protein [Sphingobium sp.]MCI1757441.1 accessory factor UbiK family protein [Sphingobium sp.]MCI2054084.1 accessory factor UbiK family protein [Sphingobium sp.]